MSISLRPSIFVSGSNVNPGSAWGHPGRVRRLWRQQCLVLSFFLLSFWQHAFFTYFSTSDSDQTWSKWPVPWPLLRLKRWWGQRSRWGHWGQKGHFHQKGIKSYRMRSIDAWLMYMNKLDPLYKSYHIKIHPGSLGVTGVKRSFSPKRHQVLQNT